MYQPKTISAKEMVPDGKFPVFGANGKIGLYDRYNHEESEILVTCRGATCGTVNVSEPKSWITGNSMVIRPRNGQIYKPFLRYLLEGGVDLRKAITGAAQPQITRTNLTPLEISYPASLSEQKRIVEILDEAFDGIAKAIANAQRNLANAGELLEALLEKALEPQEGWKATTLANIAEFKNGLNFTRTSKGETIRIVGVKDFQNEYWVPDDGLECVTIDGKLPPLYELQAGDILTVRSNGNKQLIGRCIIVGDVPEKTSHSGFTIRIRATSSEVNPEFLAYALKSKSTRARLVASGGGANISSLNQGALSSLPIKLPSRKEQAHIVATIHSMTDMCKQLQNVRKHRLLQLEEMKQSLLHKAFTGQLTGKEDIAA